MPATEETYRRQPALHVVFALSSLAMLVVIIWMILADHLRSWKEFQRQFQKIEVAKLEQAKDEKQRELEQSKRSELDQVQQQIQAAEEQERKNAPQIAQQQDQVRKLRGQFEDLDTQKRFQKATLDSQRSTYSGLIDQERVGDARAYIETTIRPSEDRLREITRQYETVVSDLEAAEAKLADLRGHKADLIKKKEDLERNVQQADRALSQKEAQYGEGSWVSGLLAFLRSAPGIDMAAPPTKIQQITLPELTINYNFKEVPRFDRCRTCHLGIDRIGFDTDAEGRPMPEVFASHPHLTDGATTIDPKGNRVSAGLYLDGNGPHKINSFGCTICHDGQGSGTSFTFASHEPDSLEERERWEEEFGWEKVHHWDFPMLPTRFLESSCLKCHYQVTDIPEADAPKLLAGFDRITKFGCTGCHTIGGEGAIGPDLTDNRQVGPNLAHLGYKVNKSWALKWIKNPHAFRPDTRMPRFYSVNNNDAPADLARNDAEVLAITHYLFQKSTRPEGFVDPPSEGNAEHGKELFLQKGCMACHSHRPYTTEDVPLSLREGPTAAKANPEYHPDPAATYAPDQFPEPARPYATADFGPNLSNIAAKFATRDEGYRWLANWIKNPDAYHPMTLMPNLQLSWQDAADIASWIISVPGDWPLVVPEPTLDNPESDQPSETELALTELVRLYKSKTEPLTQLDAVVEKMSPDEKLMYLGEKTIGRLGCFGCHNIPGFEDYKPIGTPLNGWGTKSPAKLDFAHIAEYLLPHDQPTDGTDLFYKEKLLDHDRMGFLFQKLHRPRSYDYQSTREAVKGWDERLRMPQFSWADNPKAVEEVMTFVLGLTGERLAARYLPNTHYGPETLAVAEGRKLIERYNCKGCHVLQMPKYTIPVGTKVADAMPDFDINVNASYGQLGRGLDYPDLETFIPKLPTDPDHPPKLEPDDGRTSVTIEGMPTRLDMDDDGRMVLQGLQLWQPVTIRGYTFNVGDNLLVNLDKVQDPADTPANAPDGGHFAWLFAYHQAERSGDPFADVWNRLPPPLIREGHKVQTPWLTRFLKDPYSIRPAANLRMPRFHYNPAQNETKGLANFFPARDGAEFPYQDLIVREQSYLSGREVEHPDYLGKGWEVLTTQNSACLSCHAIGTSKPTGGADTVNGPDLRQVYDRFRPEFLAQWLARPQRLVPYTAMPQNVPPEGPLGVPVPKSFDEKNRLLLIYAMRDTLLNYASALEQHLAAAGESKKEASASQDSGKETSGASTAGR